MSRSEPQPVAVLLPDRGQHLATSGLIPARHLKPATRYRAELKWTAGGKEYRRTIRFTTE